MPIGYFPRRSGTSAPTTLFCRLVLALAFAAFFARPALAQVDVTAPGNPIVGVAATAGNPTSTLATVGTVAGANNYPAAESPPNAIDNIASSGNKYLNFAETNVGLIVTPTLQSVVTSLRFTTANDAIERDPLIISLEGSNDPNATTTLNSTWVTIYSGPSGLATNPGRNSAGELISFSNSTAFLSYRLLVTSVRDGASANSMQFSELELVESPTTGACCYAGAANFQCAVLTEQECSALSGIFSGTGTNCSPAPCFGACCGSGQTDGCILTIQSACEDGGGTFLGDGTTCDADACAPLRGACCFAGAANFQCAVLLPQACDALSGTFAGEGTDCDPAPCLGACCATADPNSCYIATRAACEAAAGSYRGDATACDPTFCSLPCGIACPADVSVDNDPGQCGAVVLFQLTATGNCAGLSVICNPPAGSVFPVGTTTVTCTASDGGALVASCSFTVTVRDAEPPTLTCQDATIRPEVCGQDFLSILVLTFEDNCELGGKGVFCPGASLTTSPTNLACLPLGEPTSVTITATDCAGNTSTCTSIVTVEGDDCNDNGVADICDICQGTSLDCNDNWVPDECECFWCNVEPQLFAGPGGKGPPPEPEVNAQLSHLGGGTPCGEKVADDFYLEPGCMHRITAVRGRLLTNSIAPLRRARVELYEDCNGAPVDAPFFTADYNQQHPIPSEVIDVEPALDGYSVVTYRFNLCDECLWLEGGKTYWVSLIGLSDNIDMVDLSYWVAGPEQLPMLGNIPVKRSGTPGATWGSCTFGPWESLSDCCIGCVNMDFCVDGYSCPILWDNGKVDLVDRGGSPSGAHQQYADRTADSFVVKTCVDEDICLIEAWIWTNCDPAYGFIELYHDQGCGPQRLEDAPYRSWSGDDVKATKLTPTWSFGGRTYRLWHLQVKSPDIILAGGHNYWLSAGAFSTGNYNSNSFFAWSKDGCEPCNGVNSYRITPGQHRTLRPPPTEWADVIPARDFAFRISAKAPNAIPPDGQDPPEIAGTPPACPADANNNGEVTVEDIFTFLSAWFVGCP